MSKDNKQYKNIPLILIVVFTAVMFLILGKGKRVEFWDEVYTYTITNSNRLIEQFDCGNWYTSDYVVAQLTHGEGDSLKQTLNTVNCDMVHPPLYYICMYIMSCIFAGSYTPWIGLIVNIFFVLGTVIVLYFLFRRIFKSGWIAAAGVVLYLVNQSTLSDMMLIRMYMAYTFWVALFFYVNIRLMDGEKTRKTYVMLMLTTVGGFMTQYFFALFAIGFFIVEAIYETINKKYKYILYYLISMVSAVGISTVLWRHWINGIFNNFHSGSMKENVLSLSQSIKKTFNGISMMNLSIFQDWAGISMHCVVILLIALLLIRKKNLVNDNIKKYVFSSFAVALFYGITVRVITPDYLNSSRYYYTADMLMIVSLIICLYTVVLGVVSMIKKDFDLSKAEGKVKLLSIGMATLVILSLWGVKAVTNGVVIEFYGNTEDYDKQTENISPYYDIPWIIYGGDTWMNQAGIFDYAHVKNFNVIASDYTFEENEILDNYDQFIVSQVYAGDGVDPEMLYLSGCTGKTFSAELVARRGFLGYYLCTAESENETSRKTEELDKYIDIPWIVYGNSYKIIESKQYDFSKVKDYICIDSMTGFSEKQIKALKGSEEFVVVGNLNEDLLYIDNVLAGYINCTGTYARVEKELCQKSNMIFYLCKTADGSEEIQKLDQYTSLPWIFWGKKEDINKNIDYDFSKINNYVEIDNDNKPFDKEMFKDAEQFIVVGNIGEDALCLDNSLYYYIGNTGMFAKMDEELLSAGWIKFYLCSRVIENN